MRLLPPLTIAVLAVDVLLLSVSIAHIPTLLERPWIPFGVEGVGDRVLVRHADGTAPVAPGDVVLAWERLPIREDHDVEFLSESRSIGDLITLTVERNGTRRDVEITLVPAYALRYGVVTTIVGVITWCVGVFVFLARPRQRTAGILHCSMVCMGVVTMLMPGRVHPGAVWPYLTQSLFFLTYAGVAAFFFHFTLLFPVPRRELRRREEILLYVLPAMFAAGLIVLKSRAMSLGSLPDYARFRLLYDGFHVLLVVYVLWGLGNFVRAYRATREPDERKKLKWLLWGLTIGPLPFLGFITIPELFVTTSPVPEEFALLPLVAIPVAFAISFIRYQILDIEIVIHRTTVYAIVLVILALVYAGLIWLISVMIGIHGVETTAIAAVVVGLAFEPARRWVQHSVDRLFFQVRYDFRQTERKLVEEIRHTYDPSGLAALMSSRIEAVIPVERIAFVAFPDAGHRPRVLLERNFPSLSRLLLDQVPGVVLPDQPIGVRTMVEGGVRIDPSREPGFREHGAALAFAMKARDGTVLGMLILGRKRSGARFSAEDVDLLSNVCAQAALVLERVMLHGALIRKQTEAEHLQVLNEMKSEFVSSVSHELRTPLTSIKMFIEMLKQGSGPRRARAREYLEIIHEEAARLDRLVATVLDAAMIEREAKTYTLRTMDLAEAVRDAFATMRYQLKANGFTARLVGCAPGRRCIVRADRDAVVQAVINLVGNAIKFSVERRWIRVSLVRGPTSCRIRVVDRGLGITAETRERLFQRYFRDPESETRIQGFGIGLAVVKHIMDAHGGSIEVQSTPGRGSTFSLVFPVPSSAEAPPARRRRHPAKGHR